MNTKKIIASVLVLSMALGLTACSKGNTKKFEKYFENNDYELIEYKEYTKLDFDSDELEDGVYFVVEEQKQIKKQIKRYELDYIDEEDVARMVTAERWGYDESTFGIFYVDVIVFNSDKAAADAFEDSTEAWEDKNEYHIDDMKTDSDDEYYIYYTDDNQGGYYLDGKMLIIVESYYMNDEFDDLFDQLDDFCDEFELKKPSKAK